MYPNPEVAQFISDHFVPVRVHARQQSDEFKRLGGRFGAHWTPTILIVDTDGQERHRIEGFLPADDFLPQLLVGLGHAAFERGDFDEAERYFRQVLDQHGDSDAAAEAMYWAGVSRYKGSNDASALKETARLFQDRFRDTPWAKKASVWAS